MSYTQEILSIDGSSIKLRFQRATNNLVCIADVEDEPVILTPAGDWA